MIRKITHQLRIASALSALAYASLTGISTISPVDNSDTDEIGGRE